jgi:hypothetical protein
MSACGRTFTLPQWSDFGGWDQPSDYTTIQLGRIGGKPGAALLGRSSLGLWVERFDAERGQWAMLPTNDGGVNLPQPNVDGWNKPEYYYPIRVIAAGLVMLPAEGQDAPRSCPSAACRSTRLSSIRRGGPGGRCS